MVLNHHSSPDPVRDYLQAIGKVPLLTHEEHITLAMAVQAGLEVAERIGMLEEKLQQKLSDDDYRQLELSVAEARRIVARGKSAQDRMMKANLRLVVAVAKKYTNRGLELLDLIQEGSIGLHRAIEKFDPEKGYQFSTYAYWWIRQAITRAVAEQSRTIRLPIHITEKLNKLKKVERKLIVDLGRCPTPSELRTASGFSREEFEKLRLAQRTVPMSLERLVGTSEDTELGDLIAAQSGDPLASIEINSLLEHIDSKTRYVLEASFGLNGPKKSLATLGTELNITRQRVQQLQRAGIEKLRKEMGVNVRKG
jgi:RNA polymerase nonessential primary-like sigma factor